PRAGPRTPAGPPTGRRTPPKAGCRTCAPTPDAARRPRPGHQSGSGTACSGRPAPREASALCHRPRVFFTGLASLVGTVDNSHDQSSAPGNDCSGERYEFTAVRKSTRPHQIATPAHFRRTGRLNLHPSHLVNLDLKPCGEYPVEMLGVGAEPLAGLPWERRQFQEYVILGIGRVPAADAAAQPPVDPTRPRPPFGAHSLDHRLLSIMFRM